ncbi:MAG TPA: SCP2 sterol-binding domain-containing protein [Candidatus Acidoferrales bacterium]|nr:SCP2 sterol-binding domain-containing protein [Candidatus Acidoferrales bacterium]
MTGKCARAMQMLSGYMGNTLAANNEQDWQSEIQFDLAGEEPFYISIDKTQVKFRIGRVDNPDVVLSGRSATFFDVMIGKLDPDEAYIMKKYDVKGSVVDAMRFRRICELTEEAHKTTFSALKTFGKLAFK